MHNVKIACRFWDSWRPLAPFHTKTIYASHWECVIITSISLTKWYPHRVKYFVVSYNNKRMCKVSQKNIHYGDKTAILNLIMIKLHRIHGRIIVYACARYCNKIFFKMLKKCLTAHWQNIFSAISSVSLYLLPFLR